MSSLVFCSEVLQLIGNSGLELGVGLCLWEILCCVFLKRCQDLVLSGTSGCGQSFWHFVTLKKLWRPTTESHHRRQPLPQELNIIMSH